MYGFLLLQTVIGSNPDQAEFIGYNMVVSGLSGAHNVIIIPNLNSETMDEQTRLIADAINKER